MKTLLHLMAKDLRFCRTSLVFYWGCLLICVFLPFLWKYLALHWATSLMQTFSSFMVPLLMLTLLLSWIHLDHPRSTDGFLQTRPLSPALRALPKLLLWALLVLLPAVIAVLLQLALYQLDLDMEVYLKLAARTTLMLSGTFGFMTFIIVVFRLERLAMSLCVPVMLITLVYQMMWGTSAKLSLIESVLSQHIDLHQSRHLMALNLAGIGGFVFAAWRLARGSRRTLILCLIGIAGMSAGAKSYWPINLFVHHPETVHTEPTWLRELWSKSRVKVVGHMPEINTKRPDGLRHGAYTLSFSPPQDTLEWPRLLSHVGDGSSKLARGQTQETRTVEIDAWHEGTFRPGYLQDSPFADPPMPLFSLMQVLGLPHELSTGKEARKSARLHSRGFTLELQIATSTQPLPDRPELAKGRLVCEWYRPVVLAKLPLQTGAAFTHHGHAVRLLGASMSDGRLRLKLRVTSHEGWKGEPNGNFNQDPDFQLCVANLARGEIAVSGSNWSSRKNNLAFAASQIDATVEYDIWGAGEITPLRDASWLQQAELFIIKRQSIGRTDESYQGELTMGGRSAKP